MAKEYIEREAALNASKIVYIECIEVDGGGYEDGRAEDIPVVFKKDIESLPIADVVPIRHDGEEQGRIVFLPVKAGDTVYQLRDKKHALGVGVHPRHISCVRVYGNDWIAEHQGDKPCAKKDLGKTWFLTREEAEAAINAVRCN